MMKTDKSLTDCHFCSTISKTNGEDPIGTAATVDHWLIFELPQPWSEKGLQENPQFKPLLSLVRSLILKKGILLKVMLIAPDREYSQPGYTRIFYYHRPARLFAEYEKQEFLVPETEFTSLVAALLQQMQEQPHGRSPFEQYRQQTDRIREILVCTHANVDVACGRFGHPIYQKLRSEYASEQLRVWRCSHFGGHRFAPTLVDLPQGRFWGHIEPEILDRLIHHKGSVADLRQFYRGWAGISQFEQIAEREIWIREGWKWLNYDKAGRILQLKEKGLKKYLRVVLQNLPFPIIQLFLKRWAKEADAAKVGLEFSSPDSSHQGAYEANIEVSSEVQSALKSGKEIELKSVKQYRVIDLNPVQREPQR